MGFSEAQPKCIVRVKTSKGLAHCLNNDFEVDAIDTCFDTLCIILYSSSNIKSSVESASVHHHC